MAWRDCAEWERQGLKLSTTSNEAAKMYDAVLSQRASLYDDPSVGGLKESLNTLMAADPQFVMGQVVSINMALSNSIDTVHNNPELCDRVDALVTLASKADITPRERKHVDAMQMLSQGDIPGAIVKWQEILAEHPTDLLAVGQIHQKTFVTGKPQILRDTMNGIIAHWTPQMRNYSYVKGILAAGFAETNLFSQAEKAAKESLAINPSEIWATHSLCHLYDNSYKWDKGLDMIETSSQYWQKCTNFNCHILWHKALFHLEKGEYDKVMEIYDNNIERTLKDTQSMLSKRDATSLLYRLELDGYNIGDRWDDVYEICRPHIDDHCFVFNDTHILMSCLGAKKPNVATTMVKSLKQWASDHTGHYYQTCSKVGIPICEAFVAASDGDFAKAVDLIHPVRYDIINIGGSGSQRDVFNLFLINAAISSSKPEHHKLATSLIYERKALKEDSPLTDRMMARVMALHAH